MCGRDEVPPLTPKTQEISLTAQNKAVCSHFQTCSELSKNQAEIVFLSACSRSNPMSREQQVLPNHNKEVLDLSPSSKMKK